MPTPDYFAAAFDAVIDGPLAVEATYMPQAGAAFSLRIIPDMEDATLGFGHTSLVTGAFTFRARLADLYGPAAGDGLYIEGSTFTVQGAPTKGPRHLWWQIEAAPDGD